MEIPPSNDDVSSSDSADSAGGKTKKAARPRARPTRKPRTARAEGDSAAVEAPASEMAPPAPEPPAQIFQPSPPPAAYSFSPEPEPSSPSPENSGPSDNHQNHGSVGESQGHGGQGNEGGGAGHFQGGGQQPQHRGGGGAGGGGHGEWQDRNSWKRNKRKRGRHGGGPWQPNGPGPGGGGGGGGPSAPLHPPQLPPPSAPQHFGDLPNPAHFTDLAALDAHAKEISSGFGEPVVLETLYALSLAEVTAYARAEGIAFEGAPTRKQLQVLIFEAAAAARRPILDRGYIDMNDLGAFIVHEQGNYRLYSDDAYLPESLINRYGLKRGHHVEVLVQAPQPGERCPSVVRVDKVMGLDPRDIANVTPFEELVPYYPLKRILLEDPEVVKDVSMRAVDILTPIGFGQRGLIVAPPRTGKTVLMQNIANSISANSPDVKLILLLIDERPEEVTDFKRHTKGEVVSSTFDETPESHVHCAEMVGEKARRLVEQGQHVVILLDSITRLARAYNALSGNAGKTMSGGLESNALQKPKRFFGAARNIEGGGSLTIIATALIDTGSRMDEIIFEEFKGTGNCEVHLDRGLVERRIFPAINIDRSGTRKEELIYHPDELQRIYGLRRAMQGLGPIESMEMLITRLKKTKSNAEFLLSLSRQ
jgi:transcription termination factor Rho